MTAVLSPDHRTVTLRGASWAEVFDVKELPSRLRFYRGLWGRGGKGKGQPGPNAGCYCATIAALESVAREVMA